MSTTASCKYKNACNSLLHQGIVRKRQLEYIRLIINYEWLYLNYNFGLSLNVRSYWWPGAERCTRGNFAIQSFSGVFSPDGLGEQFVLKHCFPTFFPVLDYIYVENEAPQHHSLFPAPGIFYVPGAQLHAPPAR